MSGYLAFDRDRVASLAGRLVRSLDELDRCRPADTAATDADDALRRAVDRLGPWVLRLATVAGNGVLTDLFSWGGPAGLDGMVVIADGSPVTTPADAALAGAVLADRFARLDLDSLTTEEAVAELETLLGEADPLVVAAFLREVGPDGLVRILRVLSVGVEASARGGPLDVEGVVDLVRTMGTGLPAVLGDGDWSDVWTSVDLEIAAVVVAAAAPGLDDTRLTELSTVLLHRVADLDDADPSAYWRHAGVSVLTALADRPKAARQTLVALDDGDLAFMLFRVDPGAAGAFVTAATNPAFHRADDARAPITRILDTLAAGGDDRPWPSTAATASVGASVEPDWWLHRESRFTPTDPRLPTGIGAAMAPWLGRLVAPIQIAGWSPEPGAPEPWDPDDGPAPDDDVLTNALTLLMAGEADALALRLAASAALAGVVTAGPATQQHAAYLAAAIEDAARAAGYHGVVGQQAAVGLLGGLLGLATGPLPTVGSTAAGFVTDAVLAPITPDLRQAVADGEAAGFGVAATLGYAAVVAWRAIEAPGLPPLPPLVPPDEEVSPDDRADEEAGEVARLVEDWAETIDDPVLRRRVLALYNRVEAAAAQGVGFVA